MAEYSKPKVTIDLDEYNDLKETEKKYNESGDKSILSKVEESISEALTYAERFGGFEAMIPLKYLKESLNKRDLNIVAIQSIKGIKVNILDITK
jgi:hypothetical protein